MSVCSDVFMQLHLCAVFDGSISWKADHVYSDVYRGVCDWFRVDAGDHQWCQDCSFKSTQLLSLSLIALTLSFHLSFFFIWNPLLCVCTPLVLVHMNNPVSLWNNRKFQSTNPQPGSHSSVVITMPLQCVHFGDSTTFTSRAWTISYQRKAQTANTTAFFCSCLSK